MTIVGLDVPTFVVVAALMTVCAGGIGRLLWLLEGRPPLDRPSWWPGVVAGTATASGRASSAAGPTSPPETTPARLPKGLAAIGACAVCCGAPLLVLAGVVSFGVASTVSVAGGLLLLVALLMWAKLTGRLGRRRRPRAASRPSRTANAPVPTAAAAVSCCGDPAAAEPSGDGLAS